MLCVSLFLPDRKYIPAFLCHCVLQHKQSCSSSDWSLFFRKLKRIILSEHTAGLPTCNSPFPSNCTTTTTTKKSGADLYFVGTGKLSQFSTEIFKTHVLDVITALWYDEFSQRFPNTAQKLQQNILKAPVYFPEEIIQYKTVLRYYCIYPHTAKSEERQVSSVIKSETFCQKIWPSALHSVYLITRPGFQLCQCDNLTACKAVL